MANYPSINHRPCCNGTNSGTVVTAYNHFRAAETGFPRWANVSKRYDYHDDERFNPAGTNPYERYHLNHPSETSCIPADVWCKSEPGAPPDTEYCEFPWTPDVDTHPANWIVDPTGQAQFIDGVFNNDFVRVSGTVDYAKCRKIGFKNVFAGKLWHGRRSYTSQENGAATAFNWCFSCASVGYNSGIDPVKYRTITGTASYSASDISSSISATASAITTVGRYDGQLYTSCSASSDSEDEFYSNWSKGLALGALGKANENNQSIQGYYARLINGVDDVVRLPRFDGQRIEKIMYDQVHQNDIHPNPTQIRPNL